MIPLPGYIILWQDVDYLVGFVCGTVSQLIHAPISTCQIYLVDEILVYWNGLNLVA